MSISVTKNQNTQHTFNPLKWTIAGAAAGYITKDVLPVAQFEKDHYKYDEFLAERKADVKRMVNEQIEEIKAVKAKGGVDAGYDTYLKFVDNTTAETRKQILQEAEQLPQAAKTTFFRLKNQVDESVRAHKKNMNFMFDSVVKRLRPTVHYVAIGALLATGAAFIGHAISKMAHTTADPSSHELSYDA